MSYLGKTCLCGILVLTIGGLLVSRNGAAETKSILVGTLKGSLVGIEANESQLQCLTRALEAVVTLYRERGLPPIRTRLTVNHDALKGALKGPHAILELGSESPKKLFVAITNPGSPDVIVPFDEWNQRSSYSWLALPNQSGVDLAGCLSK